MDGDQRLVQLKALNAWIEQSNILLPILLSVIAAVIFWLIFSYIPEQKRRNKLRPIVKLSLFDAYKQLFSLFDLVMRHSLTSPSFFQSKIHAGKLSEDDIKLGLQNKCLNESYLYEPHLRDALLVAGEAILDLSLGIDELCNKVLIFHTHATSEELILLERIREKIRTYHFGERDVKKPSGVVISGKVFHPIDPSLSYQRSNLYELYKLFSQLQKLVLNHSPLDRDRLLSKIQHLYHSDQYDLCAKLIRSQKANFEKDATLLNNYLALSEHKKGKTNKFYKIIEDTYKSRPYGGSLASSRNTFKELLGDNKLIEILSQSHSLEEIDALRKSVELDAEHQAKFETANKLLETYYRQKSASASMAQ